MIAQSTLEHFLEQIIESMRRQADYSERILKAVDPNWTGPQKVEPTYPKQGPYEDHQAYGSPWAPVESRTAKRETEETEAAEVEASYYTLRPEVETVDDVARKHLSQPLTGPAAKERQDESSLMIIQASEEVSKRGEKLVNPDISGKNLSLCMKNLLTSSFPASVRRKCQNSRVIIDPWLPPPQRCDFRFLR